MNLAVTLLTPNVRIATSLGARIVFIAIVSALALTGCRSGSSIDRAAAQKVSDSFMANLVADRVNDAVGEMEPEIFQWDTRQQAEATQYPKGVCFFSVEVVPIQNGFGVTTFGPLKLQAGKLPEWAR